MINGRFTLDLVGQERTLVADFNFIETIELSTVRKPIFQLLDEALNGRMHLTDMVSVLHAGLKSNGDTRLSRAEIGNDVIAKGMANLVEFYIKFLTYAVTGNSQPKVEENLDKKK